MGSLLSLPARRVPAGTSTRLRPRPPRPKILLWGTIPRWADLRFVAAVFSPVFDGPAGVPQQIVQGELSRLLAGPHAASRLRIQQCANDFGLRFRARLSRGRDPIRTNEGLARPLKGAPGGAQAQAPRQSTMACFVQPSFIKNSPPIHRHLLRYR